ncbi:hypothetical protein J3E68DRAFT_402289 [Trichoderma sp. SZMC 28012]
MWLGWLGGGYNLLGFYIHDVRVEGLQRKGTYCLVMLENLTDPIIPEGRNLVYRSFTLTLTLKRATTRAL